jgi:hypothetical protein
MASKQFPKGSFPGWRTMTSAERYNARMHLIFERARVLKAEAPAARAIKAALDRPADYDQTCIFCETGEDHEH